MRVRPMPGRPPLPAPATHRPAALAATALAAALALAGCSGDDGGSGGSDERTPQEALAAAEETLQGTTGVQLSLNTDDLPEGVTGVSGASGVATHAPAFEGDLSVVLSGQEFEVPVVAVDGKVHVQLPLTTGWQQIDPSDYGAPDPAAFIDPDQGFPAMLGRTTGLEEGESVRGGADNNEVLTEYTGTVPAEAVQGIIPSASGDFEATYTVSGEDQLREAVLTGVFYEGADEMTYTIDFDDYGTDREITAP